MKISQVSTEFLFSIGLIVLIFIVISAFVVNTNVEVATINSYVDKKNECLKIANLINSVFEAGDGTVAEIKTKYLVTIYEDGAIKLQDIENVTIVENKIAVLASEAGETSQTFYDTIKEKLNPDWYKICFSDLSGSGCQKWQSDGMEVATWNNITKTLNDLIQNINKYNTIYLEDSHIHYNAQYGGKTYLQHFQEWVAAGNVIILSEHTMCREQSSGTYPSTSYRCNPAGYNSDIWTIFNNKLYQRGGSYGNDITVIIEPDSSIFPNLHIDNTYDFEENSYIKKFGANEATVIATYNSNNQSAIIYWKYGNGLVFYFGDFQVELNQETYSNILGDLIEKGYSLITPRERSEVFCTTSAKTPHYELTGDLTIKNDKDTIIIQNETSH